MYNHSALSQYQKVGLESKIAASNPHGLVAMLLDGALEKLARASGFIERGDVSAQGAAISGAINIIDSLRASLDIDKGGEIAQGLNSLYDYMERRLLEANIKSDSAIVAEVVSLISQIKSAWDAIPSAAESA
jgi:flagellar secretion chaperone FliS